VRPSPESGWCEGRREIANRRRSVPRVYGPDLFGDGDAVFAVFAVFRLREARTSFRDAQRTG